MLQEFCLVGDAAGPPAAAHSIAAVGDDVGAVAQAVLHQHVHEALEAGGGAAAGPEGTERDVSFSVVRGKGRGVTAAAFR